MNSKWIGIAWYSLMIICGCAFIAGAPRIFADAPVGVALYFCLKEIRERINKERA